MLAESDIFSNSLVSAWPHHILPPGELPLCQGRSHRIILLPWSEGSVEEAVEHGGGAGGAHAGQVADSVHSHQLSIRLQGNRDKQIVYLDVNLTQLSSLQIKVKQWLTKLKNVVMLSIFKNVLL